MHIADWEPTKNDRLCSKHFEQKSFYRISNRTCLLDEAIPTVFEELPSYLQEKLKPKRAMKRLRPQTDQPSTSATPDLDISRDKSLEDTPRKRRIRRQLFQAVRRSSDKSIKLKQIRQTVRRCKKKIVSLKQILKALREKDLLSLEHSSLLKNLPNINKELIKRKLGKKIKYSPELRKFAITLSFFSPKAYDYVRQVFDTCLPHRSTIGKWFKNVNGKPGFTKGSFEILKNHVQLSTKPTYLSLIIDEMSIRKQVEWDGKKMYGYVNYGVDLEDDGNAMAKETFVLLVNSINGKWKLPVGYFLTEGLSGSQKSALVSQCIKLVQETGASVVSLTFDGAPSNISMVNILGYTLVGPSSHTAHLT
ncbi:hypothetical protein HUJ05_007602 [Dendroctonus ponderosae]|nr:hypothetical protein HUJ05_007602 [Dendroctonus ponderosae]